MKKEEVISLILAFPLLILFLSTDPGITGFASLTTDISSVKDAEVKLLGQFSDKLIVDSSDIIIQGDKASLYQFQNNVDIAIKAEAYSIKKDNIETMQVIVEKTITANENLNNFNLYEIFNNLKTSGVSFEKNDFEAVSDNIVKWRINQLNKGGSIRIRYALPGNIDERIYSLKTFIEPVEEKAAAAEKEYKCGDGVCTSPFEDTILCPEDCEVSSFSFSWGWAIGIGIFFMLGLFYINFYRGKGELKSLVRAPFKSSEELKNIKKYIKLCIKNKMDNAAISAALLEKGWTKAQIIFAYDDLDWDRRANMLMKIAPQLSPDMQNLKDYVKKCLDMGIEREKIKSSLLEKGWKQEQIDMVMKAAEKKPLFMVQKKEEASGEEKRPRFFFEEELKKKGY